jgi:hypothetical protein
VVSIVWTPVRGDGLALVLIVVWTKNCTGRASVLLALPVVAAAVVTSTT